MRRLAVLTLVLLAGISLSCGGGVFFVSTNGNGVSFFSASGTVSTVQLTIIDGRQVTIITLLNNGAAQTFDFCGDTVHQFPVDAFVTVSFTSNGSCDAVDRVSIR